MMVFSMISMISMIFMMVFSWQIFDQPDTGPRTFIGDFLHRQQFISRSRIPINIDRSLNGEMSDWALFYQESPKDPC